MIRTCVTQSAPGHAHNHRYAAAPPIPNLRGVVDELIESGRDEVVELQLADGPFSGQRSTDAHAEDGALGQGGVDDPAAELVEKGAQQQKRVAVLAVHVL